MSRSNQSPCPSRQFDTYIGSNPNLDAEESESLSFGVDWDFWEGDMMSWKASATWISLELDNTIDYVSAGDLLNQDYSSRSSGGRGSDTFSVALLVSRGDLRRLRQWQHQAEA